MIKFVAKWDRTYCELAKLIEDRYRRNIILERIGLKSYKIGLLHQAKLLNTKELNNYKEFLIDTYSSSICFDKNFSYNDEVKNFKWTEIKGELISNYNFVKKFNMDLYKAWENERSRFIINSQVKNFKGRSRKFIIKSMINEFSSFSYSKELSKSGNMVFTKSLFKDFYIAFYIDTGNLSKAAGMPKDTTTYLSLAIALYESESNDDYIRHFVVKFDAFYPINEGVAFLAYSMIKNDLDLIALLNLYFILYTNIEEELTEAIKKDIKVS